MLRRCVAPLIVLVVLGFGCETGPNYVKPQVKVPQKWTSPDQGGEIDTTGNLTEWWKTLHDPVLDDLIARSVKSNFDLRLAEARVREARAARGIVAASLWPNVGLSGAYTHSQSVAPPKAPGKFPASLSVSKGLFGTTTSVTVLGRNGSYTHSAASGGQFGSYSNDSVSISPSGKTSVPGRTSDLFQAGFDASWELDIFGGNRRSVEAANADIQTAVEQRRDVLVSLASEVALNYIQLRAAQNRLEITQKNIAAQADTVKLTRERFQAGLTSELDTVRAESLLDTTQSQLPALESQIEGSIHELSLLLGKEPGALAKELDKPAPLPTAPATVPVGLPSDLLRRRPDIRASERELAAATARIGVAVADLYPKFSLTGALGGQSRDLGSILDGASQLWSFGPRVSWPLFDAGRIRANIGVQRARRDQAAITYEKTIMTALGDVENGLVSFAKEQVRRKALQKAVDANRKAVRIANARYVQGLEGFLSVLTAEQELFQTEDQLVQSKSFVLTDLVSLYKALGGGWQVQEAESPAVKTPAKTAIHSRPVKSHSRIIHTAR